MKTDMPDKILQTFALDWHQLMLKSEKHPPQPFEKLQTKAKQAINALTLKQVMELIGEDGELNPKHRDKTVDDAYSCSVCGNTHAKNQLRAELRQSAERIWK